MTRLAEEEPLKVCLLQLLQQGNVLIVNTSKGTDQKKEDEKYSKFHNLEITTVNILMYNLLYMCVYILYLCLHILTNIFFFKNEIIHSVTYAYNEILLSLTKKRTF